MMSGWSFFPWPILFIAPIMAAMFMFMALRMRINSETMNHKHGIGSHEMKTTASKENVAFEDPLVTLRDRYVRGEIDTPEFERRLESLLRSDPAHTKSWWN